MNTWNKSTVSEAFLREGHAYIMSFNLMRQCWCKRVVNTPFSLGPGGFLKNGSSGTQRLVSYRCRGPGIPRVIGGALPLSRCRSAVRDSGVGNGILAHPSKVPPEDVRKVYVRIVRHGRACTPDSERCRDWWERRDHHRGGNDDQRLRHLALAAETLEGAIR